MKTIIATVLQLTLVLSIGNAQVPDNVVNPNSSSGTTIARLDLLPNLAPYRPSGWSDAIVISNNSGTTTDASLISSDQAIYVDFAFINKGTERTGTNSFHNRLYVDGVLKYSVSVNYPYSTIYPGAYKDHLDANIGSLPVGTHTFSVYIDIYNNVVESIETDNQYTRTVNVVPGKGCITTQVLAAGTNALIPNAIVQVFDGAGALYLGNMAFQPAGDPHTGYFRYIVPDFTKDYTLRVALSPDSTYSKVVYGSSSTITAGNTYVVRSSDFSGPSWSFNGVTYHAYPRQFFYGKAPVVISTGSLNITLSEGENWGSIIGGRVKLFNNAGSLVGEKWATNAAVSFGDLAAGTYWYQVFAYRKSIDPPWGEIYMGQKTGVAITAGGVTNEAFFHNTPYMPALRVYNNVTNRELSSLVPIPVGTQLRIELDVKNPSYAGAQSVNAYSKVYMDRDKTSPWDYELNSSTQGYSIGQTRTTVMYVVINQTGNYYLTPGAFVPGTGLTDGANWYDPFFVFVLPDTTTLLTPSNGSTVSQPFTFKWTKVEDASKYWLRYSWDNWLTTVQDSSLADTLKVVSGLPVGATVKWNVATGHAQGWNTAGWAKEFWFKVLGLPDTTTLLTPSNGSTVSQPFTFRWIKVKDASKYWLRYSLDSWLTMIQDSSLTDTFKVVTGLPGGATVKWNVSTGSFLGWNTAGWAKEFWFTTAIPVPTGTLQVLVSDAEGWGDIDSAEVRLSNSTGEIATRWTDASSIAVFSDLPSDAYSYKVYVRPLNGTPWASTHYLGMKDGITVQAGKTTNEHFFRNAPYALAVQAYNNISNARINNTVLINTPIRIELLMKNPGCLGAVPQIARGRLCLDQEKYIQPAYSFDGMGSYQFFGINDSQNVVFHYTPTSLGPYFYVAGVLTSINGNPISTEGTGWREIFNVLLSSTDVEEAPEQFAVLQNYPNPFNPTTTIEYTVEKSAPVLLKMVDILGRETVLVDQVQAKGGYRQSWMAQGSGVYFAVLETGGQRRTIRMLAVK